MGVLYRSCDAVAGVSRCGAKGLRVGPFPNCGRIRVLNQVEDSHVDCCSFSFLFLFLIYFLSFFSSRNLGSFLTLGSVTY